MTEIPSKSKIPPNPKKMTEIPPKPKNDQNNPKT